MRFSRLCSIGCLSLVETANWALTGKLQFWSYPSESLNSKSSNTDETLDHNLVRPHSVLVKSLSSGNQLKTLQWEGLSVAVSYTPITLGDYIIPSDLRICKRNNEGPVIH